MSKNVAGVWSEAGFHVANDGRHRRRHHSCMSRRVTSPLCLTVELNVGGIVAAVLVTLILLGLLIFGIWFAYSRGYFESKYCPLEACWSVVAQAGL